MFVSLILILIITTGGFSLTYLFAEDEPLMWGLCAGNVVGQVIFGLVCFVAADVFGLTTATVLIALLITALPLILLSRKNIKQNFSKDRLAAKQKLEGTNFKKLLRFSYYAVFLIVFYFFFDRSMLEMKNAIYTGGSNNFGDLPYHLGAIFSFTDGQNFPPQNPSYADVKFTYPFIADLIAASFVKIGANVRDAMFMQNITLAFSLLVILERFTFKLTNNRLAGKIAPLLLFFCGGLGFLWFFKDASETAKSFYEFMWNLPRDYTISENFRFGNSLNTLFGTQRSLLLGMPLTIIVLQKVWKIFINGRSGATENKEPFTFHHSLFAIFLIGLLAGTLPLVHLHSLFCLFVVSAILFFFSAENWREWIAFGAGVIIIAIPELIWALTGSATHADAFIEWFFGWDVRDLNFFWFWLKNTGIFIPVLFFGLYLIWRKGTRDEERGTRVEEIEGNKRGKTVETNPSATLVPRPSSLLIFYLPFAALFIISNVAKLAPWEWDNIKVLIYWFVGSIPFVAYALAWLWEKGEFFKIIAAVCLITLTLAGALDVWRQVSGALNYEVFRVDAVKVAEQIKQRTPPNALFLNAPTFNSAVVLSGRRSLMRYTGHLASHGIDFKEREDDVKRMYAGDGAADLLLKEYGIEYILVSPEERAYFQTNSVPFNETYLQKFPVVAEAGEYKVYKVQ